MGTVHCKDILKNEEIFFYQGRGFYCIKKYVSGIFILASPKINSQIMVLFSYVKLNSRVQK